MDTIVKYTPFEYGRILALSEGNNLILTDPSLQQGRGSHGNMNYFTQGGYYG
jgi:hypothetical protein